MSSLTDTDKSPSADEHSGKFPGWSVVTGCFLVLATISGLGFYGLAVYLNAFSNEKGWSLSSISFATTVFFVVGGAVGLLVARLIARYDVRYVMVGGGFLAGAALAVLGQVEEQWQLFVVYGVFAVGWAAAGLVPVTTVVTRWFHTRRSVALSVASTGLSVGGVVITPFVKKILDEQGLEAGTPWLGLAFVLGVVPFAWFLIRPDPEAEGWAPDGIRREVGVAVPEPTGMHLADAKRTRFFKAITIGYILALGSQVGGIQQLVKLVEDRTDPQTAQFAITVLAATSVMARLAGGRAVQIIPMVRFTVFLAVLQCIALVVLGHADVTWLLYVGIILFGMTIGNILMLQPLLIAERFGVRDYPRIYGRSSFVAIVGTAGGPLLIGLLYDVGGSYQMPYTVAAALSLLGAFVFSLAGPATVPEEE
jgi:MFS family permease